jgi:MFS family permease
MSPAALAGSSALRAFRHRNYRLFFAGQAISLVGSWMQTVAQAWLVLTLTNDPFMLGVVAAAQWTPVLILGLFGGIIADALPKRRTLIVLESSLATLALVLGVLSATHLVQVWMILVVAVLLGSVNAIEMPVRQSFAIEMVGRSDIVNAVALNSAQFNGARIIGPAVAGLAIAWFDISAAFLINAASFLAVILGLLLMRDAELHAPPSMDRPRSVGAVFRSIGEGLGYVRRVPVVLLAVALVGVASTLGMNFQVTVPALAKVTMAGGAADFGFLMAATGMGAITAALWLATRHHPNPWWMPVGATILGLGLVSAAALPVYGVAFAALGLAGFGAVFMTASANTTIQATVPDELRGRVMSVYTTIFAGSSPVGALIAGWLASAFGPVVALGVGGLTTVVVGGFGLAWLRANRSVAHIGGVSSAVSVSPPVGVAR